MTYEKFIAISSEIKELEALLAEIPLKSVIRRMGLQSRLESAREAIANITEYQLTHKARLTFKGRPVLGSHGIAADFAAKAVDIFTEAISAIAAGLEDNLNYMGPIPDRQKNQLLITGTAIGSFGFEFELPPPSGGGWFPDRSNAEAALDKMQELFRLAAEGNDDDIAELVDEIHPRAVRKVGDFLNYMSQHDAWCGIQHNKHLFRFKDIEQLKASADRLKEDNIHESDNTYSGEFQGVLPLSRNFEFRLMDQSILKGKVGHEIEDADVLNRELLHKPVSVKLHVIQYGQGRPRYTLESMEAIERVETLIR